MCYNTLMCDIKFPFNNIQNRVHISYHPFMIYRTMSLHFLPWSPGQKSIPARSCEDGSGNLIRICNFSSHTLAFWMTFTLSNVMTGTIWHFKSERGLFSCQVLARDHRGRPWWEHKLDLHRPAYVYVHALVMSEITTSHPGGPSCSPIWLNG